MTTLKLDARLAKLEVLTDPSERFIVTTQQPGESEDEALARGMEGRTVGRHTLNVLIRHFPPAPASPVPTKAATYSMLSSESFQIPASPFADGYRNGLREWAFGEFAAVDKDDAERARRADPAGYARGEALGRAGEPVVRPARLPDVKRAKAARPKFAITDD